MSNHNANFPSRFAECSSVRIGLIESTLLNSVMEEEQPPEPEEKWPPLEIPIGATDITCKFCKRSKFLTPNTTMGLKQAIESNALTLRWRRERGNICAPCHGFQARKETEDEFRTAAASWLNIYESI